MGLLKQADDGRRPVCGIVVAGHSRLLSLDRDVEESFNHHSEHILTKPGSAVKAAEQKFAAEDKVMILD
jgi:hypothetical protein